MNLVDSTILSGDARKTCHLAKALQIAGIKRHVRLTEIIRHTLVTILSEGGIPLVTVSKLMGHSSIKVTEKYYLKPNESLVKASDKLATMTTQLLSDGKPLGDFKT